MYDDNYEPLDTTKRSLPSLSKRGLLEEVPSGDVNRADALELVGRINAGENLTANFRVIKSVSRDYTPLLNGPLDYGETSVTAETIIAESKDGDPNNVIVLGAHLDSSLNSPGINDNASGVSLLLALFDAVQDGRFKPKNKIRFVWWGTQYIDSATKHYISTLTQTESDKILMYLNFDMVSRGHFGVYDGDGSRYGYVGYPGSDIIEHLFENYFASKGLAVRPIHFHGDSQYYRFMNEPMVKPVGGLHGGDSIPQDECWEQSCDNFANANGTHLEINTKAAAHVIYELSQTYRRIIPNVPYNATAASLAGI
ncbi:hypothetical protein ABW20_dc0100199 [Dactylellina cionopaga]|nr:hypothetical protein ABW20_dc0100199 [Dactylellina cionopaga]